MKSQTSSFFFLIALMAISFITSDFCLAQSPYKFNYQGIARDHAGNPLSYKSISIKVSLLPAIDAEKAEYSETHQISTNEFGLYSIQIGNGQIIGGNMNQINWSAGNKYINIAIDPEGGSNYLNAGTNQLLSVPYAIYANQAGALKDDHIGKGGTRAGTVVTAPATSGDLNKIPKFNGTANTITNSIIYDNGSNVGIGTTTPATALHLRKTTATYLTVQADANNSTAALRLQDNNGTGGELGISKYGDNISGNFMGVSRKKMGVLNNLTGPFVVNAGGYMFFGQTVGASQINRLMIDSASGNVGIGTTVANLPTQKLDVNGQIRIRGGNPVAGGVLTSDANGVGSWQTPVLENLIAGNNSGDILVWNGTGWVATPKCNLFSYFFRDKDGDGFGDKFHPIQGCSPLAGFVGDSADCNDEDSAVNPNLVWYQDFDQDGFGNSTVTLSACLQPQGYVADSNDCDDNNNLITTGQTFFQDLDQDSFGNGNVSITGCIQPPGFVTTGGDCNDLNPAIKPGAVEICNTIDDDCDGQIDEGFNLNFNVNNCGQCGNVCTFANAVPGCSNGQCFIISCNPGFIDANQNPADGCEVNLNTHCVISGQVIPNGATNPNNQCQQCNTAVNSLNWSNKPNGTACPGGVCNFGTCVQ